MIVLTAFFISCMFFNRNVKAQSVKGADLSWVTQMEASGYIWKDVDGKQKDIFLICKNLGFNSCRLRVWVNPSDGWCGKTDVINKAKRAKAQGMSIYVAFHLSDSWADPSKQNPPAAWKNYTVSQMQTAISTHVKDVLNGLKSAGITPWFIQIGNETNDGLLWPLGKASTNPANYAAFIKAGYDAAKSVFPGTAVGVHVSNMYDVSLWKWNFGILKNNGVSWDFCAGSLYPSTTDYATKISQAKTTVSTMKSQFGKWCIVAEFGIAANSGTTGADAVKQSRTICDNWYYWEPEAYNWQGYGLHAWDWNTKQPSVILTSGLKSATVDEITGINNSEISLNLFPNPCDGNNLTVELEGINDFTYIRILSLSGSILYTFKTNQSIKLQNLNLESGTYFVQIENPQFKELRSLIVLK